MKWQKTAGFSCIFVLFYPLHLMLLNSQMFMVSVKMLSDAWQDALATDSPLSGGRAPGHLSGGNTAAELRS